MPSKILKAILILLVINLGVKYGFGQSSLQVTGTATITAASSGNWSSASAWGGSLSSNDDRVLISGGITITVDGMIADKVYDGDGQQKLVTPQL